MLRIYWDGQREPSVVSPLGDFFCNAWNAHQNVMAMPINVNSAGGMNCFFPMPFRTHARITVTNESETPLNNFFYAIDYTHESVPEGALYFHAFWRRSKPLRAGDDHMVVDGIRGCGHYVGTFMAWQQNTSGWWGEGEIKMFIDGDRRFPTICGTGTEDYFGGAWCFVTEAPPLDVIMSTSPPNFDLCKTTDYTAPFMGFQQVEGRNLQAGCRMTMYRFHVADPVFFKQDLRITMQALGWQSEMRYAQFRDDIASVAYWYQTLPHAPFPDLQSRDVRGVG